MKIVRRVKRAAFVGHRLGRAWWMGVWIAGCAGAPPPRPLTADLDEFPLARSRVQAPAPHETPPSPKVPPAPVVPAEPVAPPLPAEVVAVLGWPVATRSAEVVRTVHVRGDGPDAPAIMGKVAAGTRVWVRAVRPGVGPCAQLAVIDPAGVICADQLAPHAEPPWGRSYPEVAPGQVVPGTYYDVAVDGATAYGSPREVQDGTPILDPVLTTETMVRSRGIVEIDGVDYHQTVRGLIADHELREVAPSRFGGIAQISAEALTRPRGFVIASHRDAVVAVRAQPATVAPAVAALADRGLIEVLEERDGFVRIADDRWVARADVRLIRNVDPPPEVVGDAVWLDVDLAEQVLIGYRGRIPEFATLVSTGRKRHATPPGVYRIYAKAATTRMSSEAGERAQYDVADVPWAMRFHRGLYLHAAYWHDRFGERRSHGCINLAPRDAQALFTWAGPPLPPGWLELEIERDIAVVLRVR